MINSLFKFYKILNILASGDKTKSGSKPKSPKKSNKVELDQLDSVLLNL